MPEISEFELQARIEKGIQQSQQHQHQEPQIREVAPSYMPRYKCENGSCFMTHDNPNYKGPPKGQCSNCDQLADNTGSTCSWCGHDDVEEIDRDDLEDMDIRV